MTSWSLTVIALDKFIHIIDSTKEPVSIHTAVSITIFLWTVTTAINIPYVYSFTLFDGTVKYKSDATPAGYCGRIGAL